MGGFVLKTPDLSQPIPLDAEQIFYLVRNEYIEYPETEIWELADKDKSDGFARLVTIFQVTWFLANFVARAIQGLCVTTMELTTVSFVIILFGTAWCWKDKPSDVTATIRINTPVTMGKIMSDNGPRATQPFYHTPLDFVSRDETALNLAWQYYNDLARKVLFTPFSRPVKKLPWDRNPSDAFLRMDFDLELVGVVFIFCFSSVFLTAWNFDFPSQVEKEFWRAASIYMMAYGALGALWMELSMWIFVPLSRAAEGLQPSLFEESLALHPVRKLHQDLQSWWARVRPRGRPVRRAAVEDDLELHPTAGSGALGFFFRSHNISPDQDPYMRVQVLFLAVTSILCIFYCIFRLYILVEDIVGLRSLPPTAYETVAWTSFIPHI
ncbi:hypothetical protein FZEAL_746 [Fusarium zealandicum]|uniref:Uncharacterized protein n=1 Tax=Fusarium zealandicum TaxID=1053134 RepID=A0A8H4XQ01_9HYPO|nr:hypothetical protein FZEAL_746 [Fusarium zealandicum]